MNEMYIEFGFGRSLPRWKQKLNEHANLSNAFLFGFVLIADNM